MTVLSGIRVLDLGRFIAGPYCAALLGHMGAEVIRVERPGGSEDRYLAPITENNEGGMYLQINAGKLGMTLDIGSEDGRSILRKLIATCDVVVANFPRRTLKALGLDYDSLCAIKPDIILVASSAFGNDSPYADKLGFDGVAQAMSGAVFFSGMPDAPVRTAVTYIDFSTAMSATIGTMAAIMARQQTGEGQQVNTSLLGTALTMSNSMLIEQQVVQANRVPRGNEGQITGPTDLFRAKDGWIIVQVVGPYIFKRWARLMGDEEKWLNDPRFADDVARG